MNTFSLYLHLYICRYSINYYSILSILSNTNIDIMMMTIRECYEIISRCKQICRENSDVVFLLTDTSVIDPRKYSATFKNYTEILTNASKHKISLMSSDLMYVLNSEKIKNFREIIEFEHDLIDKGTSYIFIIY